MQSTNTLGRYHIIREIARSNDIVYEAMDPTRGKRIALKELQIPSNLVGQARQERIQRFTREARAAARLQHPSIVRIFDHGHLQGRYYIAMEFLEGQSLRDLLRQRGALPLQEALRIAGLVADGLEFAHRHGVVHRDVKPDNVHLEPDGRVVITDFGIARLTFEPTLTADGQIFGTPSYMSPEQVTGKGIDKRSDVFSLGIMLYEMIAGRKPFTGDSVITITYNIMNMELPPLPGAPAGVDQVIRRATAKDPERRYRSASEMAEDLRAVAQGGSPRHAAAMPPSPPPGRSSAPPARPGAPPVVGRVPAGPPPAAGARQMPPPVFGAAPPAPYSVPGARPMPAPPRPAVASAGGGIPSNGAPYPSPASMGGAIPAYSPMGPVVRPRHRRDSGWDMKWLLGWLGVAVVLGVLVLTIVWASVSSYDRFRKESQSITLRKTRETADKAFRDRRFDEALSGYLQVANSGGDRGGIARKNAAQAAVELAQLRLDAKKLSEAEGFARQALQLNGDSPAAYLVLGRVLAGEGKVDEAVGAFDSVDQASERVEGSDAGADEKKVAREFASTARLWKADTLYRDGVEQMTKDPGLARARFEETIKAAPQSQHARNARIQIAQLEADASGGAQPVQGLPPAPMTAPGTGAPLNAPPGWDFRYR